MSGLDFGIDLQDYSKANSDDLQAMLDQDCEPSAPSGSKKKSVQFKLDPKGKKKLQKLEEKGQ